MSGPRDGGSQGPPGGPYPEPRAGYREESGRLVLTNPHLRMALSNVDGTIVSVFPRDSENQLVAEGEAAAEGVLWRLRISHTDGTTAELTSRDCTKFSHTVGRHEHEGGVRLWLQWRGFPTPQGRIEGVFTAHLDFPRNSASVLFRDEIELPEGWAVNSLEFPCLCSMESPDPLAEEGLFLPLSGGILVSNPRALLRGEKDTRWKVGYPGPASMQFFGYSCGDRTALWLGSLDPSCARKTLAAGSMPGSNRLRLWIAHQPTCQPDGSWSSGYPTSVGVSAGDWFEAAQDYRRWAATQAWCSHGSGPERHIPTLTSAHGIWFSHWGSPPRAVGAVRDLLRTVNVPVKLDWRCWHGCARDGAYPDYFPPREGEDAFAAAEAEFNGASVLDQVNINGLLSSRESKAWQQHDGSPHTLRLRAEDSQNPLARPLDSSLSVMCPGTSYWQSIVADLAQRAIALGADGVLVEDVGAAVATTCQEARHEHGSPHPGQWSASIRSLLGAIREKIGDKRHLATDGPVETVLDLVNTVVTDHCAAERGGLVPEGFGYSWQPIPLFAAVYHDYTTTLGPPVSLGGNRPHDPFWDAEVIADLHEPERLLNRDYQMQFCLEVARAVTWGCQPVLEGFDRSQTRSDSNNHKLAFLAAAYRAHSWGVGVLVPQSRFLGPVAVECPSVEIEFLVNPLHSTSRERSSFRRSVPAVLGSAFRVPGGALSVLLVNIDQKPVDFIARLRSSRLNLQLPLRLTGRTFSEDGDAPAAALRATGSDLSGRLPTRAIVLVSLR